MTTAQLQQLLEQIPNAARLVNSDGETIAQNTTAQHEPSSEQAISEYQLGDDWRLETWKTLRASDPDLRALANGLAHTLRNPLSSIMTAADLVKDDPGVSEESGMLLGIVAKESRQLNRILTDFLNYVRPRPNPPVAFDLAQATRRVVEDMKRKNQIPETVQIRDELPQTLPVWGDENAIHHTLCHVIQNAVEAMQGEGVLHLSGESVDGHKKVHVSDSGPGFSEQSLKRAFEPFYSDRPENAGLGLSMALAAIERAGGHLTLQNLQDRKQRDIEYSMSDDSAAAASHGARVCIELRSPTEDDEPVSAPTDEVVTT
jgi:signal transduction histidine kinase